MERTEAQKLKDLNKQIQDLRVKVRSTFVKGTIKVVLQAYGFGLLFIILAAPLVWLGKYIFALF